MSDPRPPRFLTTMNKLMVAVQKCGIPTGPAMVLTVPGRTSGKPRSTPMTPFRCDDGLYVVAGYPGATGPPMPAPPALARCAAADGHSRWRLWN